MSIKDAYQYFYFQIFKSINSSSIFSREFRATLYLDILFILVGLSGLYIYGIYINPQRSIDSKWFIILYIFIICIPNFYIFNYKNKWKDILNKFDTLPKKTNQRGRFIVIAIIVLIIGNFIFSIYLMDKKAKENHSGPYSVGLLPKLIMTFDHKNCLQQPVTAIAEFSVN